MSSALYNAFIPVVLHHLNSLSHILEKAEQYCEDKRIPQANILEQRLFPNMFPLVKQIQIATDMVKAGAARITASDIPSYPDDEVDFAQLRERIARVSDFLTSLPEAAFDGAEERQISFTVAGNPREFKGQDYLYYWVLPNFYFHKTTAYNLLRHVGVDIGKKDFLS